MKRVIFSILLIIISFVLQTTLFKWLSFGGIVPNLLIIVTASAGFIRGDIFGLVIGFFCGLLTDIFFGTFIGLNALFYMYIGYLNGKFHQVYYEDDIKLPMILIVSSDFVYSFGYYVILFLLRSRFDFGFYLTNIIIPEVVYTMIVSLLYYPIILLIHKILKKSEEKDGMKFA